MERQIDYERTVALDGNFKLVRLVENIVKILGIQLGSEEGVSVHCSKLAKVPRMPEAVG